MMLLLTISLLAGGPSPFPDISFPAHATGVSVWERVLREDVNADGHDDFVLLTGDGSDVVVVPGPRGAGTPYGLDVGPGLVAFALGDLTGDGRPDLVTLKGGSGSVPAVLEVRAAAPNGTFREPLRTPLDAAPPSLVLPGDSLQVGDVTGDGLRDVLVRFANAEQRVDLLRGDGAGHLAHLATVNIDGITRHVRLAQLDDDAALEFAVATGGSSLSFRFFGVDDGQTPELLFALDPVLSVRDFALGDVDGDGWDELVGGTAPAGAFLRVWRAQGDGTFAPPTAQAISIQPTRLEDVDGDGLTDLVGESKIASGLGGLAFDQARQHRFRGPLGTTQVWTFHPEDVDGDGDLDLLALARGDDGLVIYEIRRDATGQYERDLEFSALFPQLTGFRSFGDVDGDGFTDLTKSEVIGNLAQLTILPSDGAGGFGPRYGVSLDLPGGTISLVATGDFDGDGAFDLVTTVYTPGQGFETNLFFQVAPLRFGAPIPTGLFLQRETQLGDVDGDGRTDVVTDPFPFMTQVHFGDPGGLVPGSLFPQEARFGSVLADMNGDGRADVVRHRRDGTEVWLARADRTFDLPVIRLLPPVPVSVLAGSLVAGDLNGDGNPDLVARRGLKNVFLPGAGNGNFGPWVVLQETQLPVAIADLDEDGVLDLYSGYERLQILRGAGNGLFDERLDFGLEYDDGPTAWLELVRFVPGRRQFTYSRVTPRLKFLR